MKNCVKIYAGWNGNKSIRNVVRRRDITELLKEKTCTKMCMSHVKLFCLWCSNNRFEFTFMRSVAIRHIFDKPQRHKENAGFAGNTFPCESTNSTSPVTRKEPLSFTLICTFANVIPPSQTLNFII